MKYVFPYQRKYTVEDHVNEIGIPMLRPLFNDEGGRGPELRPIIHDLALH